jgi:hypothetical protein
MRKRLLLVLALLAIAPGYVVLSVTAPKYRLNWETLDQIDVGMSEKEVQAILGGPPTALEIFGRPDGDFTIMKIWRDRGAFVGLLFYEGKLREGGHILQVPQATLIERLARRLGMVGW